MIIYMYIAHAGHQHLEQNVANSLSQPLIIGLVVGLLAVVVLGVIIFDRYARKRGKSK